ncbi:hypothetical protein ONZ45_g8923 [Pleurotus djamor]|nr:hypothetical protein ONZ45_g8923 [Pleurotus djamor]
MRFLAFFLLIAQVLAFRTKNRLITSADGTKIYTDATGDPSKQSIVFVHGFALSSIVFDNFFTNKKLQDHFYLIRYDARGHGLSDKPSTESAYSSLRYAQDFAAVMSAYKLDKPIFLGWSLGAAIVSDIAEHIQPMPLLGAVACDGSPVLGPEILAKLIAPATAASLATFFQDTNVTTGLAGRTKFINSCFQYPDQVPFNIKASYFGSTLVQPPAVSVWVTQREQNSTKLFEVAEKGGLPLLVLFGKSDIVAVESEAVAFVKPHFKKLTTVTIPGGHAIFEDNPDGTAEALIGFVRSISNHPRVCKKNSVNLD